MRTRHIAPLLAAAATAAIAAAPVAAATITNVCLDTGRSAVCQKPGHAELSIPNLVEAPSSIKGPFIPPYYPWR